MDISPKIRQVLQHWGYKLTKKDLALLEPNKSLYNLKVHNNKNLYVSGSSVFPTSGYTNPTFTIVQLSLRLGDHISKIL